MLSKLVNRVRLSGLLRLSVLAVLATTGCKERESRRLGEVYLYKAVPQQAVIGSDRSSVVYMLRGPGYPASENANRIFDLFSGLGAVGPQVITTEARRLYEEAQREYRLRVDKDEATSPAAKALHEIMVQAQAELEGLSLTVHSAAEKAEEAEDVEEAQNQQATGGGAAASAAPAQEPGDDEIQERIKADKTWELKLTRAIFALMITRQNLRRLDEELNGIMSDVYDDQGKWITWDRQDHALGAKYPLFLQIGPMPLTGEVIDGDILAVAPGLDLEQRWPEPNKRYLPYLRLPAKRLAITERSAQPSYHNFTFNALRPVTESKLQVDDEQLDQIADERTDLYRTLFGSMRRVHQNCLTIKTGLDERWEYVPIISRQAGSGTDTAVKPDAAAVTVKKPETKEPMAAAEATQPPAKPASTVVDVALKTLDIKDAVRYRQLILVTQTNIRSARKVIDRLVTTLGRDLEHLAAPYVDHKVTVEVLASRFDRLVPRHPNRLLQVASDSNEPPTRLTVMLKRLFIKFLDTGDTELPPGARGASLLVTCEVQNGKDVAASEGAPVLPIIMEEYFSPGHFVNVRDRIVYGPKVYEGEFLNIKLDVVRLSNLDQSALGNGLDMAMTAIGSFSPGLASVSPFVSSFFKGIVNNIDEDAVELSYQFTFPALEGQGKADIDLLRAETGHYILLKRENQYREEYNIEKATRRYTNNDLIYNPENGQLYHRKDMENPHNNFTPENLFREQTYAVLAVTDEYVREDDLGQALRQQLSRSLGEEVGDRLIPSAATTQTALAEMRATADSLGPLAPGELDGEELVRRTRLLDRQQALLWSATSEFQKALIVDALYQSATVSTQRSLGKNIDAWKRASLRVDDDGLFVLDD